MKFMKAMFLHLSVILSTRGESLGKTQGEVEGSGWGFSRPIPRGKVGVILGDLQAQAQAQGVYPSMH